MTMANSTESASRIPVTLRRSSSLRQKGERCYRKGEHQQQQQHHHHSQQQQQQQQQLLFPAITENSHAVPLRRSSSSLSLQQQQLRLRRSVEDSSDLDSVRSFGSNCSNLSAASTSVCEHAHFGLNGTTWSARSRRYVVHCSPQAGRGGPGGPGGAGEAEQYLTPTQRSARQLRNLQTLLREARQELDERDHEVARLTKELVELRLLKAAEDCRTDGSEAEAAELCPEQRQQQPATDKPPLDDSGHFEEAGGGGGGGACHFERRIDEMQRRHQDELQLLKQAHHDRLEGLLNQLADVSSRYCEAGPALEQAQARGRQLQAELDELRQQLCHSHELLADREERNKRAYLEIYAKGQEAARMEQQQQQQQQQQQDQSPRDDGSGCPPAKVSVAELLQQLTVTQAELDNVKPFQDSCYPPQHLALACRSQSLLSLQEAVSLWVLGTRKAMYRRILESRNKQNALDPEITLQFLKSAIYYFLTDKENLHGHLNAIESILGFTDSEKLNIDRIYRSAKK